MNKLTHIEKKELSTKGYSTEDLREINQAIGVTTYTLILPTGTRQKITEDEAIKRLGREEWLRGISRSAFHTEATRYGQEGERVHMYSKTWAN